ncbi:MAG: hypothetical protein A2X25_11725 [Chloroflexi bacterium GWB2_49_20]|nr:MAG: hypothetical protein A2X25_11725 [Chloroflexi bacterium GWB2_49_20]OGN77776.1 MAG: hypothetical protein A2X26_09995 [Chloroflexi bacterium GWC2_49_37]OGN86566.1 MAG: hypothetical protein A2X27_06150 [Chloroflexi bacterium GWD2_49_16]HBG74694.1 hypothetical protein [Anaerolineae bacterium]
MIQGVINRIAHNSFLIKGWTVLLISSLFALAANNSNKYFLYLAYFPAISFWILDGYYLWQEKLFRALFDHVRLLKENDIDYSMNTSFVKERVAPWERVIFSKTISIFHGIIFILILLVMIISLFL